jgi:hypothetical protein
VPRPSHLLAGLAAAVCLAASGCGDSSSEDKTVSPAGGQTNASTKPAAFPSSQGKTLVSLRQGLTEGPILAAGVSLLEIGRNRFSFALIDRARKQLTGAEVAVYVSDPEGGNVEGPFEARSESLVVDKRFESKTTAQDPQAPKSVYVVNLPFRRKGQALVMGIARLDSRLVATSVDLADVLGKRPVVLMFATPRLCASRTCGPVVDVMEQVKAQTGSGPAFIHVEVYKGNDVSKGFLPQLLKWRLPTEPWTFVIDRVGIVRERFEGTLSVAELRRAVAKVA